MLEMSTSDKVKIDNSEDKSIETKSTTEDVDLIATTLTENKSHDFETVDFAIDDWKMDALIDVLDKQYRLYSWNDQKTGTLITTNSVLFAAIGFLFDVVLKDPIASILILIALALLACSLWIALSQVIPQGSSGKSGMKPNIRSLRGIASFGGWREYDKSFKEISKEAYLSDCTRQIYGMTINNDNSRIKTTKGVKITFLAVLLIFCAAVKVSAPWNSFSQSSPSKETSTILEKNVEKKIRPTQQKDSAPKTQRERPESFR